MHFTDYDLRLAAYAVIVRDEQILLTWYNGKGHGMAGCTDFARWMPLAETADMATGHASWMSRCD